MTPPTTDGVPPLHQIVGNISTRRRITRKSMRSDRRPASLCEPLCMALPGNVGKGTIRIGGEFGLISEDLRGTKRAALTSGCPAFQKHAKHAEGSDTSYVSHTRKALSTECENRNFDRNEKRLRSPAGPRRLGAATRISASLSRWLSAFFESTSRPRSQSGKVRRSDTWPRRVSEPRKTLRG